MDFCKNIIIIDLLTFMLLLLSTYSTFFVTFPLLFLLLLRLSLFFQYTSLWSCSDKKVLAFLLYSDFLYSFNNTQVFGHAVIKKCLRFLF